MSHSLRWRYSLLILLLALAACGMPNRGRATPAGPTPTLPPLPTGTAKIDARVQLGTGALTIVALGDSLTAGDGDDSGAGGYTSRLEKRIAGVRPGSKVINLGRSGWTSKDLINGVNGEPATLTQAVEAKADIALVWIGSNDLWYLYEYGPEPMTPEAEQEDLRDFTNNINIIIGRLKQSGASVFIALLDDQSKRPVVASPPNPAEPAFSAITPADLALMSVHASVFNRIIKQRASANGAIPVNFEGLDIFTNPATLYDDGNHPNQAGYETIAQIWFLAIEPHFNK